MFIAERRLEVMAAGPSPRPERRLGVVAARPVPRSVPVIDGLPMIGRGGKWGVDVFTKTAVSIPEGGQVKVSVDVKNIGDVSGKFRIMGTLGKFAPEDIATGGPLFVGGPMKFYWAAGQSPNPGNLAINTNIGTRSTIAEIGAGLTSYLSFVSVPLKTIKRWDGNTTYSLDAHWTCEVETFPGIWELDWQVADLSCVSVQTVVPARGRIISTSYVKV